MKAYVEDQTVKLIPESVEEVEVIQLLIVHLPKICDVAAEPRQTCGFALRGDDNKPVLTMTICPNSGAEE